MPGPVRFKDTMSESPRVPKVHADGFSQAQIASMNLHRRTRVVLQPEKRGPQASMRMRLSSVGPERSSNGGAGQYPVAKRQQRKQAL